LPTFDGLPEVLSNLRARGVLLGILTSNDRDNVSRFLAARDLQHFDFISTSTSVWGKERRLKSLLRKQRLSPSEVAYVGDEVRDIEAVKPTGMRRVAVTWGYTATERLAAHAPHHLITAPEELLKLPGLPLLPASEARADSV
jgi:phosphoglycolate phosphatase